MRGESWITKAWSISVISLLILSCSLGICSSNASAGEATPLSAPPEGITGYVRESGSGIAISGASVTCSNGQSTTTNSNGFYAIGIYAYTTVTITVSKSGYITQAKSASANPRTGMGACDFTLILYNYGTITGYVKDSYNTGILGATVSIDGRSATTSSTGQYTIIAPAGTNEDIVVTKAGYWTQTLQVTVTKDTTTAKDFVLEGDQLKRANLLAMFCTVGPTTTSRLEYNTGYASVCEVNDYAAGSGMTTSVTWSASVGAGLNNTPSLIRQKEVWVSGSYGNIANGITNVYVNSQLNNYHTVNTIPEYLPSSVQDSPTNLVWTETTLPGQQITVQKYNSGSLTLQAGLVIDVTTSVIFASTTVTLECTLKSTDTVSSTSKIIITNNDTQTHTYKFCLEGGMIMHAWEL